MAAVVLLVALVLIAAVRGSQESVAEPGVAPDDAGLPSVWEAAARGDSEPGSAGAGPEVMPETATPTPEALLATPEPVQPAERFGQNLPSAIGVPEPAAVPMPVALRLPTIGVGEAAVTPVGVEDNGDMEIPGADEVGWYRFGPTPGHEGSAVLAAHIAFDGVDGVFRDLSDLEPGDDFEVVLDDGTALPFEVVGLGEFEKAELPRDEIFSEAGLSRLALITCGGAFNRSLRSYDSNVVAFAVPRLDT